MQAVGPALIPEGFSVCVYVYIYIYIRQIKKETGIFLLIHLILSFKWNFKIEVRKNRFKHYDATN